MSDSLVQEAAILRDIAPVDAPACAVLSRVVGWPHRVEDWEMAIGLGRGVVASLGSEIVATALWWPYGETHATLGMIIVSPEHQGAGLGRRLMQGLLAQTKSRSLLLNATVAGKPLYERSGFVTHGAVCQHQGEVLAVAASSPGEGSTLRAAHASDLPELERLDHAATGLPRGALLRAVMKRGECVVIERGGKGAGFGMLRRFGRGLVIGPVVAEGDADARVLVAHWLHGRQGQFLRIDVHAGSALSDWLASCGLKPVDVGTSMVRGTLPLARGPVQLHALASQALG
jgi:GNAT superfamily N-acetyltransferase